MLPWWSVAIAGALTGFFIPQNRFLSFFSTFLGVLIFYCILIFFISNANNHILAQKISLLVLKNKNEIMIIIVSGLISALVAGISALTRRSLAIVVKKS
jgi:ABC-type xylose transport system permease subunit